jgi:hypothetical protein
MGFAFCPVSAFRLSFVPIFCSLFGLLRDILFGFDFWSELISGVRGFVCFKNAPTDKERYCACIDSGANTESDFIRQHRICPAKRRKTTSRTDCCWVCVALFVVKTRRRIVNSKIMSVS